MKTNKAKIISLSLCAIFALQTNLLAQDENEKESLGSVDIVSKTEDTTLYTVDSMNTATKMNLSIKETPQSLSVVTSKQIEDQGITTLKDSIDTITGLSTGAHDSERIIFSARGFTIDRYQIDGISTRVNDTYSAGETVQDLTVYDRVEVVRGANGLLSGAGNPSASINLIRKRADSKEFKGKATLKAGSWNKYGLEVDVQGSLNESGSVRGRAAASYEEKDSFMDYYHREKTVVYGVVDADLSDNTQVSLGASYQENQPTGSTWGGLPGHFSDGTATSWERSKSTAANWTEFNSENLNFFGTIEHYFANDIKLNASYSQTKSTSSQKSLFIAGPVVKSTGAAAYTMAAKYDIEVKQDNLDIYTTIPFDLVDLEHEIVLGLTHSRQKSTAYNPSSVFGSANLYTWDGSFAEPVWGTSTLTYERDLKQSGIYFAGNFSLSDSLNLVAGTRVTNWEIEELSSDYEHKNIITPYVGLVYDINKTYSTYVSYTDIFKPQDNKDSSGTVLDPIVGKNYEAGVKASFFEDKLNASFAVFKIEQDNLAQNDPSGVFVPGTTTIASIGAKGATSKGYEIDVNGSITPDWNMSVGYAKFKAVDEDNKDINTAEPRKTFKLFTTYQMGKLNIGGGINFNSKTYYVNTYKVEQKAYSLVNLMGRYEFSNNLSAQVNINNVFDKKYYSPDVFGGYTYGDPRNATVQLKYTF